MRPRIQAPMGGGPYWGGMAGGELCAHSAPDDGGLPRDFMLNAAMPLALLLACAGLCRMLLACTRLGVVPSSCRAPGRAQ